MSLWRYIGRSYDHHFPLDEWWNRDTWPDPKPPCPVFYRLCKLLCALGLLRVEEEGGYYIYDGRWTWRFWRPHRRPLVLVQMGVRQWVPWREYLVSRWPGFRFLLTGKHEHRRWP